MEFNVKEEKKYNFYKQNIKNLYKKMIKEDLLKLKSNMKIMINSYKFKPDEWNFDGQIYYKPPFKDPEDTKDDFYKEVK